MINEILQWIVLIWCVWGINNLGKGITSLTEGITSLNDCIHNMHKSQQDRLDSINQKNKEEYLQKKNESITN